MKAKFWKASATTAVSLALALPTAASANATPAHDVTSPIERSRVDSVPTPTIRWKGCGDNLECATVQLPLDYDKPNAQQISIGLTRIPARNPEARIGSLFLNPGGPGASGTEFPQRATQWLGDDVQDRFDLIGMDPRGINQSTNTECFPNMKTLQRRLAALAIGFPMTAAETGEFGPTTIEWADDAQSDPVLADVVTADGIDRTSVVTENHNDWVVDLPVGATALAHSDRGIQAFRAGSALGVQFHPEGSPASARDWQHRDREALTLALHAAAEPILLTARALARGYANQVKYAKEQRAEAA